MTRDERKAKLLEVDLYPVTCERLSAGRSNVRVLEGMIEGGARMVQLREKDCTTREFLRQAVVFREITARAGVLLILNDRLDLALACGADGVHLGQDDLPVSEARRIAPDLLLGASSHSREEALRAQDEDADYVNIGPIFLTSTKAGVEKYLGPDAIAEIAQGLSIPFTVMGGINAENIGRVVAAGARRVAVVTAVTMAPDIAEAVRGLRQQIGQGRLDDRPRLSSSVK